MYKRIERIHLIGVGGIGMSGIAQLLLTHGYRVSGSDLSPSDGTRALEMLGLKFFPGHNGEHVAGAQLVVHSSAISETNPEFAQAKSQGIPLIPRAEMLAELMRLKHGIAVAGSHGKTTTTSMVGNVLMVAELDPTIVVGGRMDNFGGSNARAGKGDFMVVEADESDGSFTRLSPSISVVTNIDREHMDHYQSMPAVKRAFATFASRVPFYGLVVGCGDDRYVRQILSRVPRRTLTYGFGTGNQYTLEEYAPTASGSHFRVRTPRGPVEVNLCVPGRHNALNAVAALAVGDELDIPRTHICRGLSSFQGVQRRFQLRGTKNGVTFIDDYAHHPKEIASTLAAARERFPKATIRAIFQPHRYSRLEDLFDEFAHALGACDAVAILDVYAAGESPIEGVSGRALADRMVALGHHGASHFSSPMGAVDAWLSQSQPGDLILTLGAGDLPNVYRQLF